MGRIFKWVGLGLAAIILLVLIFILFTYFNTLRRMSRTYQFQTSAVNIPSDAGSIANGKRIYVSHCTDCHQPDLGGGAIFDDPTFGKVVASNLTSGLHGAVGGFTDEEWVLAIRHGIGPDRKTLAAMPAQNYYHFNDRDLGQLIAYIKSVEPVDRDPGQSELTFLGTLLSGLGLFGDVFPAEHIDHSAPRPAPVAEAANVEFGEYVVAHAGCRDCHGKDLHGGRSPDPSAMQAPNITSSGRMPAYDGVSFTAALRSGLKPENEAINAQQMPWPVYQHLTDTELQAAYLYLASLK